MALKTLKRARRKTKVRERERSNYHLTFIKWLLGSVDTGIPTVQPAKPKVVEDRCVQ